MLNYHNLPHDFGIIHPSDEAGASSTGSWTWCGHPYEWNRSGAPRVWDSATQTCDGRWAERLPPTFRSLKIWKKALFQQQQQQQQQQHMTKTAHDKNSLLFGMLCCTNLSTFSLNCNSLFMSLVDGLKRCISNLRHCQEKEQAAPHGFA